MSLPALQPGLRALDTLRSMPAEHGAIMVLDDGFEPHLLAGELAVYDLRDRDPQHGELYVVAVPRRGGESARRIVQAVHRRAEFTDGPGVAWWLRFQLEPGMRLVDGPLRAEGFAQRALGRIVGVLDVTP